MSTDGLEPRRTPDTNKATGATDGVQAARTGMAKRPDAGYAALPDSSVVANLARGGRPVRDTTARVVGEVRETLGAVARTANEMSRTMDARWQTRQRVARGQDDRRATDLASGANAEAQDVQDLSGPTALAANLHHTVAGQVAAYNAEAPLRAVAAQVKAGRVRTAEHNADLGVENRRHLLLSRSEGVYRRVPVVSPEQAKGTKQVPARRPVVHTLKVPTDTAAEARAAAAKGFAKVDQRHHWVAPPVPKGLPARPEAAVNPWTGKAMVYEAPAAPAVSRKAEAPAGAKRSTPESAKTRSRGKHRRPRVGRSLSRGKGKGAG